MTVWKFDLLSGGVATASVNAGGSYTGGDADYPATQALTSGSGSGAEFTVTLDTGAISAVVSVDAAGQGYAAGDTITLLVAGPTETTPAVLDVDTISGPVDTWAAEGNQDAVPGDRLQRVYASPIRYTATAMSGLAPDATPVDDGTTIDISIVKVSKRPSVADPNVKIATNYQLASLADNIDPPAEVDLGPYSEIDVDPADQVAIGIRSITVDTAVALWVEARAGLEEPWSA